jgi:hypothetical protein
LLAAGIATTLLLIGGLSSLFAGSSNCTGGEADLVMLTLYACIGFLGACILACAVPHRLRGWMLILAAAPFIYSAAISANVAYRWWTSGWSACRTFTGELYPIDGGEGSAAPLTVALTLAITALLWIAHWRSSKNKTPRT